MSTALVTGKTGKLYFSLGECLDQKILRERLGRGVRRVEGRPL
jgi:hypothetical protein